ncbi:MAG TPA: FHA domain-containing protein [Polyangiaceae bacterium]
MVNERAIQAETAADSGLRSRAPLTYALREDGVEHRITKVSTLLGRGSGADIILAGGLVSRLHARLTIGDQGISIEDLGSRNGVLVNGERIAAATPLTPGDNICLGDTALVLTQLEVTPIRQSATITDGRAPRDSDLVPAGTYASDDISIATRRADAFQLLAGVVDKALTLGRGEEAERLIATHLVAALSDASTGRGLPPELARSASQYAIKLGLATGKAGWLDFPFRMYRALGTVMPLPIVDELYTVLRRVRGIDRELLRQYVEALRDASDKLSPPERFVLQRLEGLERLAIWQPDT